MSDTGPPTDGGGARWSRDPAADRGRRGSARRDRFAVSGLGPGTADDTGATTGDTTGAPGSDEGAATTSADTGAPSPDGGDGEVAVPGDGRGDAGGGAPRAVPGPVGPAPRAGVARRAAGWVAHHEGVDSALVAAVLLLAYLPYLSGRVVPGVFGFNSGLARVPVSGLHGWLVGLPWIDPNVGFVSQALGHLSATTVLHGHLPWWNPFEGVGAPLAGEGQSAALFPPTLLLAAPEGQVLFHVVLVLVAGLATRMLLREMGMSRSVAAVGGVLFGLNGTFAWLTNAPFNPVAFLPVVLWGVERCRRRPLRAGASGWLLIAAGLAASVYAGFPETAYLDGLLAACWALLRWFGQPRGGRAAFAGTVAFGAAVGALVSAPFVAAFGAALNRADVGGHAGGFATSHLPSDALATVGTPYLFGPISGFSAQDHTGALNVVWGNVGGFVTAALLTAALCGVLVGRDRALRWLLAAWVAVCLARSFGVPPFATLWRMVPAVHAIAFGRYSPPSWELALVVLACMGVDSFRGAPAARRRPRLAVGLSALCALGVVTAALVEGRAILRSLRHAAGFAWYVRGSVAWALLTVALVVVIALFTRGRWTRVGLGLVLAVDAFAMFVVPELSAPRAIPVDLAPVTYLQRHLGLARFATLGPIVPNYGSAFGIAEVNAHDLPTPGAWAHFVAHHLETNERPQQFDGVSMLHPSGPTPVAELRRHLVDYEAIGVRYVVASSALGPVVGRRVFHDPYVSIYRLPVTAPFYWVEHGHCALHAATLGSVRATCTGPSALVRQELDAPGWSATTAGGRPLALSHAGPLFMAVHLPAGTTTVTFTYTPPHVRLAAWLALAGVVLAVAGILVPWRARRRRPAGRHAQGAGARPVARPGPGPDPPPGAGAAAAPVDTATAASR